MDNDKPLEEPQADLPIDDFATDLAVESSEEATVKPVDEPAEKPEEEKPEEPVQAEPEAPAEEPAKEPESEPTPEPAPAPSPAQPAQEPQAPVQPAPATTEKKPKKKMSKWLFTIIMTVVFLAITELVIWGSGGKFLVDAIKNYPQGNLVISEAVLASLVLIVMLLFKNSYVFTQKHEKITKGLYYGMFFIIASSFTFLIFGLGGGAIFAGKPVVNLLIGCFLVGVAEEFLCRGWLLNEFLERFGETKKGVWFSIIASGVIFGLIHLGNIANAGQSIPTTITQVINAAGIGIVFGTIYYKTKNIWSVIILHALWDFCLMLSDVAPVMSETPVVTTFSIIGLVFSLLMVGSQLLSIAPHFKDINAEPKKVSVILCSIGAVVLYGIFMIATALSSVDFGAVAESKVYTYGNLALENYAVTRDNYETYYIKYSVPKTEEDGAELVPAKAEEEQPAQEQTDDEKSLLPFDLFNNVDKDKNDTRAKQEAGEYKFKLYKKEENKLAFVNEKTNKSVEFDCQALEDYIILEQEDNFILAYIDYEDSANAFLYYSYIKKDDINNDDSFIESVKKNTQKFMLSERSELVALEDRENNNIFVAAYDVDYGYYVLVEPDQVSILNRDK
ncbi:CPBP family intramembrane metalloprotease [Candidatus Saccharibacteria bacterium]|nr:CPBP family intramembrane metalloprotease [Candidatus Saccharibacteria bacterium]